MFGLSDETLVTISEILFRFFVAGCVYIISTLCVRPYKKKYGKPYDLKSDRQKRKERRKALEFQATVIFTPVSAVVGMLGLYAASADELTFVEFIAFGLIASILWPVKDS